MSAETHVLAVIRRPVVVPAFGLRPSSPRILRWYCKSRGWTVLRSLGELRAVQGRKRRRGRPARSARGSSPVPFSFRHSIWRF